VHGERIALSAYWPEVASDMHPVGPIAFYTVIANLSRGAIFELHINALAIWTRLDIYLPPWVTE
jgi:hypothetical protein